MRKFKFIGDADRYGWETKPVNGETYTEGQMREMYGAHFWDVNLMSGDTFSDPDNKDWVEVITSASTGGLLGKGLLGDIADLGGGSFSIDFTVAPEGTLGFYNPDPTNPSHYKQGDIECIDAIKSAISDKVGVEAAYSANIIKYVWRYKGKNGIEDLKKAKWYLEKLIEEVQNA